MPWKLIIQVAFTAGKLAYQIYREKQKKGAAEAEQKLRDGCAQIERNIAKAIPEVSIVRDKRLKGPTVLLVLALFGSSLLGCRSTHTMTYDELPYYQNIAGEHTHVQGLGLYILDMPIVTCPTDESDIPAFFEDTVNPQSLSEFACKRAKMNGMNSVRGLTTSMDGSIWSWPVPYIITIKKGQVSMDATK